MINKIVSFGCSFSCWRQDFAKGFVDLVANYYEVPYLNYSIPGNSNESIQNEFNTKLNQYELNDSLILFQTTFLTRLSYYDSKVKRNITFQNLDGRQKTDYIPTNFMVHFSDLNEMDTIENYAYKQEYFKLYQSYIHNDAYALNKLYYDLFNIQSSVEKIGSKIIFLYFDEWYATSPMLNKLNFIRFGNELSCLNWAKKNNLTYSKEDLHLSEEGNRVLAEKLINMGRSMG
jgi:hypothetical protein